MSRSRKARSTMRSATTWSWSMPFDNVAAPNTYDLKSSFENAPMNQSFGTEIKGSAQYITEEFQDFMSPKLTPGAATYSPNKVSLHHRGNTRIGTGPARKLELMENHIKRSPGPKYQLPNSMAKANKTLGKFGLSQTPTRRRHNECEHVSYLGVMGTGRQAKKAASFKGKTGYEKIYAVNKLYVNLGSLGPGPGKYNGRRSCDVTRRSMDGARWAESDKLPSPRHRSPGPAAYTTTPTPKKMRYEIGPATFGNSPRNFDPRTYHQPLDFHRY